MTQPIKNSRDFQKHKQENQVENKAESNQECTLKNNPDHNHEVLSQVLVRISAAHHSQQRTLVVFDLDSTLFNVSPRIQKIVNEFAQAPACLDHHKEWISVLEKIKIEKTDWGFHNALLRNGITKENRELFIRLEKFWQERFFTNEYLHFDEPFDGSVEFVHHLHSTGSEVVYLTGRDELRMGEGSRQVLRKFNFPLNDSTAKLVLKPEKSLDDALFKKDWFLSQQLKNYSVIYFFENEPLNLELVRQELPEVNLIFFDSTHSGRHEENKDLPRIKHFAVDDFSLFAKKSDRSS